MNIKEILITSYCSPLVAAIFSFVAPFLCSHLIRFNLKFVYSYSNMIWQFSIILITVWIITVFIRRRMRYIVHPYGAGSAMGWIVNFELRHEGLLWKIRTPNPLDRIQVNERLVNIEGPRCPKCKTELEQIDKFYWYDIRCPYCNFSKKKHGFILQKVRIELQKSLGAN